MFLVQRKAAPGEGRHTFLCEAVRKKVKFVLRDVADLGAEPLGDEDPAWSEVLAEFPEHSALISPWADDAAIWRKRSGDDDFADFPFWPAWIWRACARVFRDSADARAALERWPAAILDLSEWEHGPDARLVKAWKSFKGSVPRPWRDQAQDAWDARTRGRRARLREQIAEASPGPSDPYPHVLGIRPGASFAEAQAAYRRLALECHPDRGGSAEQMARLNAAYETARMALGS